MDQKWLLKLLYTVKRWKKTFLLVGVGSLLIAALVLLSLPLPVERAMLQQIYTTQHQQQLEMSKLCKQNLEQSTQVANLNKQMLNMQEALQYSQKKEADNFRQQREMIVDCLKKEQKLIRVLQEVQAKQNFLLQVSEQNLRLTGIAGEFAKQEALATLTTKETALLKASKQGDKQQVQQLLARGASLTAVDPNDCNALMLAVIYRQDSIIPILMEACLEHAPSAFFQKDNVGSGQTAIHWMLKLYYMQSDMIVPWLKTDLSVIDSFGRTPLIQAIQQGSPTIASLLIDASINQSSELLEIRDYKNQFTPLMWALYCQQKDIYQLLIKKGARVNALYMSTGRTIQETLKG